MEEQLQAALVEFFEIASLKETYPLAECTVIFSDAPHERPKPLKEEYVVYIFFHSSSWLKVGYASYSPRLTSQHYGTGRAGSTLARDLWSNKDEFHIGCDEAQIDKWMFANLGHANVRAPAVWGKDLVRLLEAWLILRLKPRFEGTRN